ncbi:MAG: ErfK/YbiS/YcfS/YnhG family protein, partial [uncultured Rubellimicrobium sp.]
DYQAIPSGRLGRPGRSLARGMRDDGPEQVQVLQRPAGDGDRGQQGRPPHVPAERKHRGPCLRHPARRGPGRAQAHGRRREDARRLLHDQPAQPEFKLSPLDRHLLPEHERCGPGRGHGREARGRHLHPRHPARKAPDHGLDRRLHRRDQRRDGRHLRHGPGRHDHPDPAL